MNPIRVDVVTADPVSVAVNNSSANSVSIKSSTVNAVAGESFAGPYTITPGAAQQTISCANKIMRENVVVGPIPQNYGLISYDGSSLTVS